MIDFKKMAESNESPRVLEPKEIFNRLPKPQSFNDLHSSQAEVLDNWFNNREKKDTVIKLNTGGGKTLVGLLIALSSARELRRGALYLVDSKQLVCQVCEQARTLGISAVAYDGRRSLTADFRNGSAILVAHYQALFNGKSAFGLEGAPDSEDVSIIVIDDAHSSFDTVRDAFTVEVRASDEPELFQKIAAFFRPSFVSLDRETTFDDFISGTGGISEEVLEIPFWAWEDNRKKVARLISKFLASHENETDTFRAISFSWPLIKDDLKYCVATLSRDGFSVTPILPLVDKFPTFSNAKRRVYMSATFADEGAIIRSFGCRRESLNIISPHTLAGVGRRMILQIDGREEFREALIAKMRNLAKEHIGVVVLEPSFLSAEQWACYGFNIVRTGEVDNVITDLKNKSLCCPVVFSNRYNGIDLPGDACRLLVVSGIPRGMSDFQKLLSKILANSKFFARLIAQNIEQAIGRGTRGSGDFCVVVLVGFDLCEWVRDDRRAVFFTPSTRAQIECGQSIMKELHSVSDFEDVIDQGVGDNPDFASYLSGYVADNVERFIHDESNLESFALNERRAFEKWRSGGDGKAIGILEHFVSIGDADDSVRGLALRIAAQIAYSGGDVEKARNLQSRANGLNRSLAKPVFSLPDFSPSAQSRAIVEMITEQARKGCDIVTLFNTETESLSTESNSKSFELGLEALGRYLGASSERCDKNGDGPDVVWLFKEENLAVGFEAKNEKLPEKPFSKAEHGQLLVAEEWLNINYPKMRCLAISVHPNNIAFDNASASSALVLTIGKLNELKEEVVQLLDCLSSGSLDERGRLLQCDELLKNKRLRPHQIVDDWTEHYEIERRY